jgi:hypothetical protein
VSLSAVFSTNSIASIKEPTVEKEKPVIAQTPRTGELPPQDWETPFRLLQGVTIERAGGIEPVQVTGTVDGMPFYFRSRHGEWRVEIGAQGQWIYDGGLYTPDEVVSMLAHVFAMWRAQRGLTDSQSEVRRRLKAYIDDQHELLRRIDDATLTELVAHLRSFTADPNFDPVEFLSGWLFGHVPSLGGTMPAEVLGQPGGLALVKDTLGRLFHGLYA